MANNIIIPAAHNIGDTVYYLRGGRINKDTVKQIFVSEFSVTKSRNDLPRPRYLLENASEKFYENELYSTPQGIIDSLQDQVMQYTRKKRTRKTA